MTIDTMTFVGVDTAGGRTPFTYAALDGRGKVQALADGSLEDVLAFLAGLGQACVAVNAPPRPNTGLVKERASLSAVHFPGRNTEMRLAESELRERGIQVASTPSRREMCTHWVQDGFSLYARLSSAGFKPYPAADEPLQWLETHPQACFAVLLGQLPLSRTTIEGRLQRQLALFEAGLDIRDAMEYFEEITRHRLLRGILPVEQVYLAEELDALAAAHMALVAATQPEEVSAAGDAREGLIYLPASDLKESYR